MTEVVDKDVGLDPRGMSAPRERRHEDFDTDRLAAVAFGAIVVAGFFLIWLNLGRYRWFQGDEWTFLVDRDGGSLHDILHAHNEHIQVIPVIAWRVMWNLFGLRSYLPYQIPVLVLHLTAAVMLRIIMRRNGVNPWIATAAATVFVFYGAGEDNIVWAFQIGFTGTLAFGLTQLRVGRPRRLRNRQAGLGRSRIRFPRAAVLRLDAAHDGRCRRGRRHEARDCGRRCSKSCR